MSKAPLPTDWKPQKAPTGNALHLAPALVYNSEDDCRTIQAENGLSDVKAAEVCRTLKRGVTNNDRRKQGIISINTQGHWEDEQHLYVNCVLTSDGVHNGALKTGAEIQKASAFFENLPICILHPPDRGIMGLDEIHGYVRQTRFEPHKQRMVGTACFIKDKALLKSWGHDEASIKAHDSLLEAIRLGARLDGSIGYYHDVDYTNGVHNGTRYDRVESNLLPNHFAVVDRGASDWLMGTGFGQNAHEGEDACCGGCKETGGNCADEKPTKNDDNASKSTYRLGYEGLGNDRPPMRWFGRTTPMHDHTHHVIAYAKHDEDGFSFTVDVGRSGSDATGGHDHTYDAKMSTDDDHTHDLPEEFDEWCAAHEAYAKTHADEEHPLGNRPGWAGKHATAIYDFVFGKRRRTGQNTTPSKSANTYKLTSGLMTQGLSMPENKDRLVVSRLGINELADMNPEVKRLVTENRLAKHRFRTLAANAKKAEEDATALKERLSRFEANARKERLVERNRLVKDIVSVTGKKPEAYKALGINALKTLHGDIQAAAKFGANVAGKKPAKNEFGDLEAKHEEEELKEGGMGFDGEDPDEEEVYSEDMGDHDDEEEEDFEEMAYDGEAGDAKLQSAKPHGGGYEDYGEPRTDQGPTPNRSDRTLLANRIREGHLAQRRKASGNEAPKEPRKAGKNAAPSLSVYERISLNARNKKGDN